MRIALLTLESLVSAVAVRRFVLSDPRRIAMVGLSDAFRPGAGGALGQVARHVRRSGPGFVPYLLANFTLPKLTPRGSELSRRPLSALCDELGVPCETVPDVNADAFRDRLVASGADVIVTFHFDQILGAATLAAAPEGGLNVHPSLLPRHRGPTPTIHALLEDDPVFGVTVHRLATRIDAGAVMTQRTVPLGPGVSALTAARVLHEAALPLLEEALTALKAGEFPPQSPGAFPYQGFPTPGDLRRLTRLGRSASDWRDVRDAFAVAI